VETHIILLSFPLGTNIEKQSSNFHTFFLRSLIWQSRCVVKWYNPFSIPLTFRLIPGGSFPLMPGSSLHCTRSVLPFWIRSYIPKYVVSNVCILSRTMRCATQCATHVFGICFRTRSKQASKQLWRLPDHSACSHWRDPSFSVYPLCTYQQHQQQQEEFDDKEEMEDKDEEEMDLFLLLTGTHLLKEVPIAPGVTRLSPCPCFVAVTCMSFRELIVL